jgi:PAS domain S-box-containing protein
MTPTRMLVVDDERGLREGIRRIFEAEGFEVVTAENGTEGIARGREREFDIVLLDLMMPDVDGLGVLEALHARWPDTEYVMITAYAGIDTAVQATKLGATTYIPKPFTPDQILLEVRRALETRRLTLEARALRAEQERRLLEISREQSRLRTIINAIGDAVFVTNLEDEIVLANPQTRSLFAFPTSIKAGDRIADLLPDEVIAHITEAKERLAAGAELLAREWEKEPDLALVLAIKTAPVRDPDGSVIGYVTTLQDVTTHKRLDHQKSQFVSMVAHELKAPLSAISGYLDTMQTRMLGGDLSAYETMIDRSRLRLGSMIDLINDLLGISRMELGTARREIEPVDLASVAAGVVEFLAQEMAKRSITCAVRIADAVPLVDFDRDELVRVITNLVSNAIKYNRDGGEIHLTAERDDDSVLVRVRDTGIGMRAEEAALLFREFYRVKNEKTRAIPGTGLGLSIVKRIIESYHGNVQVESVFGEGTTFTLRIPVKWVDVAQPPAPVA